MKKTTIATFLFFVALNGSPVMAAEMYAGVGAGRAEQTFGTDAVHVSANKTAAKLFGGYQFNDDFAIEGGYSYFGKAGVSAGASAVSVKPRSLYVALVGRRAFNEDLSGYAKLGIARTSTTGAATDGAVSESVSTRRLTPMAGVGVEYALSKSVALFGEYEYYGKVVKDDDAYVKVDQLSAGFRYKF